MGQRRTPGRASIRRVNQVSGRKHDALVMSGAAGCEPVAGQQTGILCRDPGRVGHCVVAQRLLDRLQIRLLAVAGDHQDLHVERVAGTAGRRRRSDGGRRRDELPTRYWLDGWSRSSGTKRLRRQGRRLRDAQRSRRDDRRRRRRQPEGLHVPPEAGGAEADRTRVEYEGTA